MADETNWVKLAEDELKDVPSGIYAETAAVVYSNIAVAKQLERVADKMDAFEKNGVSTWPQR